jgi:hypothetical protein
MVRNKFYIMNAIILLEVSIKAVGVHTQSMQYQTAETSGRHSTTTTTEPYNNITT